MPYVLRKGETIAAPLSRGTRADRAIWSPVSQPYAGQVPLDRFNRGDGKDLGLYDSELDGLLVEAERVATSGGTPPTPLRRPVP